jgi:hypothetical protein
MHCGIGLNRCPCFETADSPRDDYDSVTGVKLRGVWSSMKLELQKMPLKRRITDARRDGCR